MKTRSEDNDLADVDVKPTLRFRILHWLWRRDIDPEALATWTAVYLIIAGFWSLVGWAIWKLITDA
jgi:hypothetical protein